MKKPRLPSIFGLIVVLFWLSLLTAKADKSGLVPRFEPADCPPKIPAGQLIECGFLVVSEDRTQPDSRTIRLAVAILKSRAPHPAPDPLIFLNGGPGGQALEDLPRFIGIFRLLLLDLNRDVILFDQRGVGLSQPALECPEVVPALLAQAQGRVLTPSEEQAPYLACRDRWLGEGVNLAAYTTAASAADVNDLWRTLGYTEVNLFGVSYGTVLAETVMRDYPDGIRSVILDSAFPLQVSLVADTAANASGYFQRVFARCAANLLCRTLYPDVETIFYRLLEQLNQTPLKLTMPHPVTGEPFTFNVDGAELVGVAQSVPPRQLPALIYDLHDGDHSAIFESRRTVIENFTHFGAPPGRAMAYSIFCSQGLYFASPEQLAASTNYPESVWASNYLNHILTPLPCSRWPAPVRRDSQPVNSDIPTLVLLGEYDQTLSPDYAHQFANDLRRSFIISVPNTGHGVMANAGPCANNLARAFFNDPTRLSPTNCLAETGRSVLDTTFVIRAAVMRLPVQATLLLLSATLLWTGSNSLLFWRRSSLRWVFAWRSSIKLVGWQTGAGSAGLLCFGLLASQAGLIPLAQATAVAVILPVLAAVQAAFLFAPDDEPALELLLTAPRPPAWALAERLAILFLWQGSIGLLAGLYVVTQTGESLVLGLMRWLPPLLCLSGLAVYITLITRRAIFGVLLVCLVWIVAAVFGDFIVMRWPFVWPFHLYLKPDQAEYSLNRLFLSLSGVTLIMLAATRLLRDEERLLLGNRPAKRRQKTGWPGQKWLQTPADSLAKRLISLSPCLPLPLHQLGAIIRYELLNQWRRAMLPVLGAGLMVTPVLGAFLARSKFSGYGVSVTTGALSLESVRAGITAEMMLVTWLGAALMLMLMLPLVVADTIPKDKHIGVRELLDSLPVSPGIYLTGKLGSVWAGLLGSLGPAALLSGGIWRLLAGPFNLAVYLELWGVGITALALINAGLAVLLAAGQPTNRRAILVGGVFSLLCLLGVGFAFATFGTYWDLLNPARPVLMLYYLIGWPGAIEGNEALSQLNQQIFDQIQQAVNRRRMMQSLGVGAAQVALVWWLVWHWLRRTSP